jgi:hypothetical protein
MGSGTLKLGSADLASSQGHGKGLKSMMWLQREAARILGKGHARKNNTF